MGWANIKNRIDKTGQMLWSKLSIKILGVHFGNSVLDNSSWDEINGSLGNNCQYIEQGATLFEIKKKKKKSILNQIRLSKLWCIVQINTIPIFIKQKSKKQCKISSGTKMYNSPWEEAQLSIWKCGLGISHIDTQSNSLELKWIQRLLNHANAFRKGLTLCLLI